MSLILIGLFSVNGLVLNRGFTWALYDLPVADPDLQIRRGGHPDPEIRGGRPPPAPPLDPPLQTHALLNHGKLKYFPLLPRLPT